MRRAAGRTVVLVGAPGSGKSTVGALLADRLGLRFIDVDDVIAERAGKSIADMFTVDGEPAFRALERETTLEVMDSAGGVVSLGGGAVTSTEIRARPGRAAGDLVAGQRHLGRPPDRDERVPAVAARQRPRAADAAAGERAVLYREVATITVPTDDHLPQEVVELIMTELNSGPRRIRRRIRSRYEHRAERRDGQVQAERPTRCGSVVGLIDEVVALAAAQPECSGWRSSTRRSVPALVEAS